MLFQGLVGLSEAMYLWLVAAGLSLIFGVLRVLNFAHGSLYMLGAYFAWIAFRISGSFWVALLVGPLLVSAVGWPAWAARSPCRCAPSRRGWASSSSSRRSWWWCWAAWGACAARSWERC